MRTSNSLYTLLQVLPNADPAVIEAAYKALMKKYHPDLHNGEDAERRAAAISQAFNVLRDPERREAYDTDERARDERHKVELARAFPDTNASPPPSEPGRRHSGPPPGRFEPPPRPGQRIATFVGVAGVLSLAATIVLLARGGNEPAHQVPIIEGAPAVSSAQEEGASPAAEPVPFRDEPVSTARISKAVIDLDQIAGSRGIKAAAEFSERCFQRQSRTMSIGDFDYCVAFDHAAGRSDVDPAEAAAARRFQPQNQVARHVRAADPLADTFASIEIRLYEIRRLTDVAIARTANPAPALASVPTKQVVVAPPPPRRYTAHPVSRQGPTTRPPPRKPRQEQDFLEREGGIY